MQDLQGWPPQASGAAPKGGVFPVTLDNVFVESVIGKFHDHLLFTCKFNGDSVFYSFQNLDHEMVPKVADILSSRPGIPLLAIGPVEIPED